MFIYDLWLFYCLWLCWEVSPESATSHRCFLLLCKSSFCIRWLIFNFERAELSLSLLDLQTVFIQCLKLKISSNYSYDNLLIWIRPEFAFSEHLLHIIRELSYLSTWYFVSIVLKLHFACRINLLQFILFIIDIYFN